MTDEERNALTALARLQAVGGLPPGYKIEPNGDGTAKWILVQPDSVKSATAADPATAMSAAWDHYWTIRVGKLPPGYHVARDERWHFWILADDNRRSDRKASEGAATREAWEDFRAELTGKQRPKAMPIDGDPHVIMARFQNLSFQMMGVLIQERQVKQKKAELLGELEELAAEYDKSARKMAEKMAAEMTEKGNA